MDKLEKGKNMRTGDYINTPPTITGTITNTYSAVFYHEEIEETPTLDFIKHVHVYNNRVVKCEFRDGSTQKAVLHEGDVFDIEVGIGICLTKYLLEKYYGEFYRKNGTYLYNKAIKNALQTKKKDKQEEDAKQKEKERLQNYRAKKEAKKKRREEERMRKFARILGEQLNGKSDN